MKGRLLLNHIELYVLDLNCAIEIVYNRILIIIPIATGIDSNAENYEQIIVWLVQIYTKNMNCEFNTVIKDIISL